MIAMGMADVRMDYVSVEWGILVQTVVLGIVSMHAITMESV